MKSSPQPTNPSISNPTNGKDAHVFGELLEIGRTDAATA
jgi:hypothetical protein